MRISDSSAVESIVWQLKLSDFPRAQNRALINDLANGMPPFTEEEARENQINSNVNKLGLTKISHDARRQFTQAFLVPDPLFTVAIDHGPVFKRQDWGQIITQEANKVLKRSKFFMETQRSCIAQLVLHGIAPSSWTNDTDWCPRADGIEDILVPSNTLCSMENLPFFAKFRSYTARELWNQVHGPNVDPGWNIPLVESAVKWVDQQAQALLGNSWPEVWSPEKMSERVKQDGGLYASDAVPTVDVYDLYYWDKSKNHEGWRRKMVLDAWGCPGVGGAISDIEAVKNTKANRERYGMEKSQFLYDSEIRANPLYADKLEHIVHFQFADCSSVAPFRYHSVRSLGFLLYSVCHLENRLGCKFNDSVFESLMQYFRVNNMGDAERALKIDLTDKRPLPDGINFVPPDQRWKIDEKLVQMAMASNQQTMQENSENFTHAFDAERGNSETATRTMAKMSSSASMVSAMLGQAYIYKQHEYTEIMRRLCMDTEKSSNVDANLFRTACLRQGVPKDALQVERMNITPTKIIAGGNKILQIAMMDKIMVQYFPKLDPSAQKEVLRLGISITTDDYQLAARWVPSQPSTSGSRHDAQLSAGLMLSGLPMDLKQGVNHDEYVETLLTSMSVRVQQIKSSGKPITPEELLGLQNCAGQTIQGQPLPGGNGILPHIQILEGEIQHHLKGHPDDKTAKQKVKGYNEALAKLMNLVKQMAQQAAEAAKKQQAQGAGIDPKDAAKIQGMMILAQAKAQNAKESHAQRTAQRQLQWEQQMKQRETEHVQQLHHEHSQHQLETMKTLSE